jgi:hypothetical protein
LRHLIATRFSVPRPDAATASRHADPGWLDARLTLFRRYYAPSVGRLGVPAVLLCSDASAAYVADRTRDVDWLRVEVQNDWRGGPPADSGTWITRLDSDDALAAGWFSAVEAAPEPYEVLVTRDFLRLDARAGRRPALHAYRRREPSPLAAFRGGRNPFAHDHATLPERHACREIRGAHLLQVVHGGNLSSRAPRWWRFHRAVPLARLAEFGLDEAAR